MAAVAIPALPLPLQHPPAAADGGEGAVTSDGVARLSYDAIYSEWTQSKANFEQLKIEYQKLLKKKNQQDQVLRAEIDSLRGQLQVAQDEAANKHRDADDLRRHVVRGGQAEHGLKAQLEEQQQVTARLQADVKELEQFRLWSAELQRRIQAMEQDREQRAELARASLEEREAEWESRVRDMEEEKQDLHRRLDDRSQGEELQALRRQNLELQHRLEEMVKDLNELREKSNSKARHERDASRQLRGAQGVARELESELAREREKAKRAQAAYEEERVDAAKLHDKLLALERRCTDASERAAAAEDELRTGRLQHHGDEAALRREHDTAKAEVERREAKLQEQVGELRGDVEQARLRLKAAEQRAKQETVAELREEAGRRAQAEQRLHDLLQERARDTEKYEREKVCLREDIGLLRQELDSLRQQRADLEEDREGLQLRLSQLTQEHKWRSDEMERFQRERAKDADKFARLEDSEDARQQAEEQLELLRVHLQSSQQQLHALREEAQREIASQRDRQERALVARDQQLDEERRGYSYTIKGLQLKLRTAKEKSRRGKDRWMAAIAEQIKRCEDLAARCERLEDENQSLRRHRALCDDAAAAVCPPPPASPPDASPAAAGPPDAAALLRRNQETLDQLQRELAAKAARREQRAPIDAAEDPEV